MSTQTLGMGRNVRNEEWNRTSPLPLSLSPQIQILPKSKSNLNSRSSALVTMYIQGQSLFKIPSIINEIELITSEFTSVQILLFSDPQSSLKLKIQT